MKIGIHELKYFRSITLKGSVIPSENTPSFYVYASYFTSLNLIQKETRNTMEIHEDMVLLPCHSLNYYKALYVVFLKIYYDM